MSTPRSPRGRREKGRNAVNAVAAFYRRLGYVAARCPFEPGIDLSVAMAGSHLFLEVKAVDHLYNLDSKDKRIIWQIAQACEKARAGYLLVQVTEDHAVGEWFRVDGLEASKIRNGLSLKVFSLGKESLRAPLGGQEGEGISAPPMLTTKEREEP